MRSVDRLFLPVVSLQQIADAAFFPGVNLLSLREVITAGEQLQVSPAVRALFQALPDCTLHNQYGPTETHVVTACTLAGDPEEWPALPTIGRPIWNARIYLLDARLVDARLEPVQAEVTGLSYVGGAVIARGDTI
jgi:non-ribosomal peptide synthetase component F